MMKKEIELICPDEFEVQNHYYEKVQNSSIHPMVSHFLHMSVERILERYSYMNPMVDKDALHKLLIYKPQHFYWGGSDLFYVTNDDGHRKMVIVETNSCPSGQKSMPILNDWEEHRGYRVLIENAFLPQVKKKRLPKGELAVIYDKNYMEASGYASTLADLSGENVYLVPFYNGDENKHIYFKAGVLHIVDPQKGEIPIRAAMRYVTQSPWNRIPPTTKTLIFNSTLICLAGGRNKLMASKAYELFNAEISGSGLSIYTPETIKDVSKVEIPLWVQRFGGHAVIKVPYSNAGQGVFTVTSEKELGNFMAQDFPYEQFIVQSLIGHHKWSSHTQQGKYYHIGTIPNKKGNIYVADLRMMLVSSEKGMRPCAMYARRTRKPLLDKLADDESSWEVLGTNLSKKIANNQWDSDTSRLMLMDRKDFNSLGLGTDDLIEAYIQTLLSIIAIDKMASNLLNKKGQFRQKLFSSMDHDKSLINEIAKDE